MSVQTEIDRIAGNVTAALTACADKGADVPTGSTSDDLAAIIAAIEAGGGGLALSNCQVIVTGELIPSENITSDYMFSSGILFGEVEKSVSSVFKSNVVGFLLADTTLGSSGTNFYSGIMAAYGFGLTTTLSCNYGFMRNSSGSSYAIANPGSVGCTDGSGVYSDSKEVGYSLTCSSTQMLIAGHVYHYAFFVRK